MKRNLGKLMAALVVLSLLCCAFFAMTIQASAAAPASIEINRIAVSSGRYLKEGASSTTTSNPGDNYAYYNNGVLTLKNFDLTTKGYTVLAQGDLTITLNGTNALTSNESNTICVTGNLTIKGDGKLTVSAKRDDAAAIYVTGDMTVSSGTLSVSSIAAAIDAGNRLFITGGSVTATNTGSLRAAVRTANGFSMTGGSLTVTSLEKGGIYSTAGNVVIDGGKINVTATKGVGIQSQKAVAISGGDITVMSNIGISAQGDVSIEGDTKLLISSKSNALYTPKKLTVTGLKNTLLFYSTVSRPIGASSVSIGDGIAASMSKNRDGSSPGAFSVSNTSTRYVYIRPAAVTVSGIGMYPGDYLKQGDTAASPYKISSGSYAALTGDSGSYQLELNNFTVQSGNYGIQSTDTLRLKLNGTNKLTSSSTGVRVESGDLTVSGSGSLQVTSSQNSTSGAGFDVRNGDYLHEGGTVTITSARYGVKAKNDIIVKSGALTANAELGWGAYSKNLYVTGGSARLLGAMSAVYYTGEFDYGSYQVSGYRSESGPLESYAASRHDDYLMLNIARHSCYAAGVAKRPATCTATGKEAYYTCLGCGKNYEDSLCTKEITNISTWGVIPAKGHTPIAGWETNGTYHWKTCTKCNIAEVPNTKVKHTGGEATCRYKAQCDVCQIFYGNFADHEWSKSWDVKTKDGHAHSCQTPGCTETSSVQPHTPGAAATEHSEQKCTTCQYVIAPKLNHVHNTVKVDAEAATCDHGGNKEYWFCSGCPKFFSDADGKNEILDINTMKLPRLDHDYAPATCTEPKTCKRADCGATEGLPVGHKYDTQWSIDNDGHWHSCTVCGEQDQHEKHVPGAAATETTDQVCTTCGYVIEKAVQHTHNYSNEWFRDGEKHWLACGCGERKDEAAHVETDGDGLCDLCSYLVQPAEDPTDPTDPTIQPTTGNPGGETSTTPVPTTPAGDGNGDSDGGSNLWWRWIVIAVVAVGGIVFFVIFGKKKKEA